MIGILVAYLIAGQAGEPPAATPPKLLYKDGTFTIFASGRNEVVRTASPAKLPPPKVFSYHKGNLWVTFDPRGITLRVGNQVRSTKLPDLVSSPRFFSRDEIVDHLAKIDAGIVSRDCSQLGGWEEYNGKLYLSPRWIDANKAAWMQAIVSVDLKTTTPLYSIESVFLQPSISTLPIEDNLFRTDSGFATISTDGTQWGMTYIADGSKRGSFSACGTGTPTASPVPSGKVIQFSEQTGYGTFIVGTVTVPEAERSDIVEVRAKAEFLDDDSRIVKVNNPANVVLHNSASGLELTLPKDVGTRMTQSGVLVWTPAKAPKAAILYAVDTLRAVSKWPSTGN